MLIHLLLFLFSLSVYPRPLLKESSFCPDMGDLVHRLHLTGINEKMFVDTHENMLQYNAVQNIFLVKNFASACVSHLIKAGFLRQAVFLK